jgi:hypothetical protein
MAFVPGVLDGFEQSFIAPWAAAIIGRTAAFDFDETGIERAGLLRRNRHG